MSGWLALNRRAIVWCRAAVSASAAWTRNRPAVTESPAPSSASASAAARAREAGKLEQARRELGEHALALRELVARMQRREFH